MFAGLLFLYLFCLKKFGVFFGAAVINPVYTGRGSRLLRRIVPVVFGVYFLACANNHMKNYKHLYMVKFNDYYPPHVREFLTHQDHRYLLLFDVEKPSYKLFDEQTKKSLY